MARVTAPLVIAKRADGSDVYLYEGAPFPDGMREGEADRLAEFLEDDSEAPADEESDEDKQDDDSEGEPKKPARKSSK